jgi:hypothetical protein
MAAAMQGEVECVRLLLEGGAKPDLKDRKGKTALDYARAHLKVWQGIVKKPPKLVAKFVEKIGLGGIAMEESHARALKDAEECVRILDK